MSKDVGDLDFPNVEYYKLGQFIGNVMVTFRMSLGDFSFDAEIALEPEESFIYWVVWLVVVATTSIIFLNFMIAEASASYAKVASCLQQTMLSEKASLICEAEEMMTSKDSSRHPKYLIIREIEC